MRKLLALSLTVVAVAPVPALAEIVVEQASYEAGILVVQGKTSHPNREVSLDGRYAETADGMGAFQFRIRYLPNDCTISLFDGEDRRTAFIRGCKINDAVDLAPAPTMRTREHGN